MALLMGGGKLTTLGGTKEAPPMKPASLYFGDNLDVLRRYVGADLLTLFT